MGQKVNPNGLRLGVIRNWNSRWFFSDKKAYRKALESDIKIRNLLMDKLSFASVTQIDIERAINKITVIIYSVKPGMIIGRGGKGLEEIKNQLSKFFKIKKAKEMKIDLKIEPVKKPYLNAYYVAQSIAEKLVKGFTHRSVVHRTMTRVIEEGAKGIKVQLGGRIAGAEISRREKYFQGTIPTSTIREDIDYANYPALTRSGYIGVKIWICK
ncbi:30S ribosomal protein S3 [Candidatus Roizmanbacteria bacterium CG22_combo_CG10-13_8_21_14_all_35_9]|uniref:Small ribosomal subunit protein uS3 n=4 Tax=Candidatus Roizmaniibacteriota TaxID=1752723 RepID=A0A2M8F4M3_9BACT|nr:MAG: 30S ribosomal protein S3 [Candidatus Roizmanbacteria bacterium CG23_combo_of_CG06-09_8_20_14_all_35_49]PIP62646.1 MAG: 30S ribosomal protein S3 [Candidatus Roizmanbacteria bacterium CG22_combo_CG10-13_8_21_14_all_35_9]PIY71191.1 MAG: 30S ribosomal protein S3 [Candidatus Roizmanbacteria bacterium CG_4_10_14_0_8_um_filter_35_28]PJC34237.1 MAG: 30S ribosomal protein S3 [Candidatus Roizmanbacteria bacterium CG_4_9_14_0_2_um_filter_35_15]PJC82619.1 MAG: 30S ribosomal protein S3 [Candidatus R